MALWGVTDRSRIGRQRRESVWVLHGQSQLHPLLALLSVLGGVQALGPIGIVVGPIIVVLLQTLLGILQREIMHMMHQTSLPKNRSPPEVRQPCGCDYSYARDSRIQWSRHCRRCCIP